MDNKRRSKSSLGVIYLYLYIYQLSDYHSTGSLHVRFFFLLNKTSYNAAL